MSLLSLERISIGEVGVKPGSVKMVTTSNLATITAAGYLNGAGLQNQVQLSPSDIVECLYSYNASTDSGSFTWMTVSISNGVITLAETAGALPLTSAHIYVGNASNVAADVAMSGDATMANTGALTIANNAVTLAKLAAGITPSHVVKFGGTSNFAGGAATTTITVTGMAATDLPFVQIQASTSAVSVQKVTPTLNTITVLFSADPGAATVLSYQVLRAAS